MNELLVRYASGGGLDPPDDELLELRADGLYTARLTVAGARIGTFAGRLAPGPLAAVRRDVTACREAGDLWLATPIDGATAMIEIRDAAGVTATMDSEARPDGPWGALAVRLRGLLEDAAVAPLAAVELVADAHRGHLLSVGAEPLDVDASGIEVSLVRLDGRGVPVARWGSRGGDPAARAPHWVRAAPGWTLQLPYDHPLELAAGDWLQVWVMVTIRTDAERRGRLFLGVRGA